MPDVDALHEEDDTLRDVLRVIGNPLQAARDERQLDRKRIPIELKSRGRHKRSARKPLK